MSASSVATPATLQPEIVRGASRGFTVFLIGGAIQPLVSLVAAPVGYVWVPLVALAAFALSAWTVTSVAGATLAHAVTSALGGYLLVVPVVVLMTGTLTLSQVASTSVAALLVSGLVCLVRRTGAAR